MTTLNAAAICLLVCSHSLLGLAAFCFYDE
jgi:hypothetical protein